MTKSRPYRDRTILADGRSARRPRDPPKSHAFCDTRLLANAPLDDETKRLNRFPGQVVRHTAGRMVESLDYG